MMCTFFLLFFFFVVFFGHDVYCNFVRACVRTYVPAYVSARPAWERVESVWLRTSDVCNNWLRASIGLPGNE